MDKAALYRRKTNDECDGEHEAFEVLGIKLEWKLRANDTQDSYCVLAATVPPGAGVPVHQHPQQEAFVVLEGAPEFSLGPMKPEWYAAKPGDLVNIPPDIYHGFRNTTESDVRVLIFFPPSLAGFFEEAGTAITSDVRVAPTMDAIQRVLQIAEKHGQRFAPPA